MARPRKIRPAHKGRVSGAGLWSLSVGERPYTVTIREDRQPGARLLLDFTERGRRRQIAAGLATVRDVEGNFDRDLIDRAETIAWDRSSGLRLNKLRDDARPLTLTVSQAFALYHDPDRGGMARSKSSRNMHVAARTDWCRHLGHDLPWNQIRRADVDGLARKHADAGRIKTAESRVKSLRTVYRWLDSKAGIDGLKDPTKGFDFRKLMEGYRPNRPRFTAKEAARLLKVRHDVDPRFALFLALVDDSGARRAAVCKLMRSDVDPALDMTPPPEFAPYGWIRFPPLKGQDDVLHFLTSFQRREFELARTGYLFGLERLWETEGKDYPLFPAARMYAGHKHEPVSPICGGAYRCVGTALTDRWLRQAEDKARVDHVRGRGWHGLRRLVSDLMEEATDLATLTTAMGWKSQRIPEAIYLEKTKHAKRGRAREAMEKRRAGEG